MNSGDVSDVVEKLWTGSDVGYQMAKAEHLYTVIAIILYDFPFVELFGHNVAPVFYNRSRAIVIRVLLMLGIGYIYGQFQPRDN